MLRLLLGMFCLFLAVCSPCFAQDPNQVSGKLTARVLAVGIPGASAVAPVGTFHKGGPIRDKPEFACPLRVNRVVLTAHPSLPVFSKLGSKSGGKEKPASVNWRALIARIIKLAKSGPTRDAVRTRHVGCTQR